MGHHGGGSTRWLSWLSQQDGEGEAYKWRFVTAELPSRYVEHGGVRRNGVADGITRTCIRNNARPNGAVVQINRSQPVHRCYNVNRNNQQRGKRWLERRFGEE